MSDGVITKEERQVAGLGQTPFKRLIKTGISKLGGRMLDPMKRVPVDYILVGDPSDPDVDIDDIMLEFYTEEEWVFFQKHNKVFLEKAYLMDYEGVPTELDTKNVLTDEDIDAALKKPFLALRNLLNQTDSSITVKRIYDRAISVNVSYKYMKAIEERLAEIQEAELPVRIPERVETEI